MSVRGRLDKEACKISIEGSDMDLDEIEGVVEWLNGVLTWMKRKKVREDGGRRWTFTRLPSARHMVGAKQSRPDVPLVQVKPRKDAECACCRRIVRLETMWKQAPGAWSGHSRLRFCDQCVSRGGAAAPPELKVIQGGVS